MTQRHDIRRPLGGHDARDAGDAEDVALACAAAVFAEELPGPGVGEGDDAGGGCEALGDGLLVDRGHVDFVRGGEVREVRV